MTDPDPKDEQSNVSEEEEVMSEVIERAMEGNVKLHYGNEIAHTKHVDVISEQMLSNLVSNADSAQKTHLERLEKMADAYMEHVKNVDTELVQNRETLNKNAIENNRFTLDRLYGLFPPEASELAVLLQAVLNILTANQPPEPPK